MTRPANMALVPFALLLLSLIAFSAAAKDSQFCDTNMKADKDKSGSKQTPFFPTQFTAIIEQTMIQRKKVNVIEEDYSYKLQQLHIKIKGFKNYTEEFYDVRENVNRELTVNDGTSNGCRSYSLEDSPTAAMLNIVKETTSGPKLQSAAYILDFDLDSKPIYVGTGVTRANIPTEMWQTCQYIADTQTTAVVTFHFAQSTVKKAGIQGALLQAKFIASSKSPAFPKPFSFRYDYANMGVLKYQNWNRLVPHPNMYCSQENPAQELPKMPHTFTFKVEQAFLGSPGEINPKPRLYIARPEYMETFGLFIFENVAPGINGYELDTRHVYDKLLDLVYLINDNTGSCKILSKSEDTSYMKNFFEDPTHIFHWGNTFQYHGRRLKAMRGIDCDIYVSWNGFTYHIWYMATKDWMVNVMGYDKYTPLPIAHEMYTNTSHLVFNMFEYTPSPVDRYPDYSTCFDQSDALRMAVKLGGSRYDIAYLNHATTFRDQFVFALMMNGNFSTPTRVIQVEAAPGLGNHIYVNFLLLGAFKIDGYYPNMDDYPSVQQIRKSLEPSFKYGSFSFNVKDDKGVTKAALIGERLTAFDDAFYASMRQSAQSGHSPGSMAGIGIGLLIGGLVFGIIGVFLFSRLRGGASAGGGSSTGMKKLEEET